MIKQFVVTGINILNIKRISLENKIIIYSFGLRDENLIKENKYNDFLVIILE